MSESRSFDATRRALALEREFAIRKAVSEEKAKQAAQSVDQHQLNDVDGRCEHHCHQTCEEQWSESVKIR